jgi:hypothetical protein
LIARIYGIFTVEMEDIQPVDLLLMANCAHTGSLIENVFDLKGSIINRKVEEWSENDDCLKDVNLLELVKEKKFLNFQRSDMRDIMKIMFKDIKYLNSRNLMDYSLLLIIENNPEAVEAKRKVSTVNNVRSFLRVSSELPEEDGEPTVRKMTEEDRKYWTQLTYVQIR